MSKYNNVNPGQYKTAGRMRMSERTNQAADRQAYAEDRQRAGAGRRATTRPPKPSAASSPGARRNRTK